MSRPVILASALALAALPAAAWAGGADESTGGEADPSSQKALSASGRGLIGYHGSGGFTIEGRAAVRVRDLSGEGGNFAEPVANGFRTARTSKDGAAWLFVGKGTLALDGSSFRVRAAGRFDASVDPTAANAAIGEARARGRGALALEGGRAIGFHRSGRVVLTRGPLSVDLEGARYRVRPNPRALRRILSALRAERRTHHRGRSERALRRALRNLRFRHGAAHWSLNGPAAGAVELDAITGKLRVWDESDAKDAAVTVPDGTRATQLPDGSTVYSGLDAASGVTVSGSAFRLRASGADLEGTFTPTADSSARSYLKGRGSARTPDGEWKVRHGRPLSMLLQGVTEAPPATEPIAEAGSEKPMPKDPKPAPEAALAR